MKLPFRRKALTSSSGVVDALRNQNWQPFPLLGGGSRQRIQDAYNTAQSANYAWMYTNSPAVRTVIDVLVRNVGQLDLRLYEEVSEQERRARPEHPAALSLRYPNEDTPGDSFIRQLFKDFYIYENAYALMLPAAGRQLHFEHLPAAAIEIRGSSIFRAEQYRYRRTDGSYMDFEPDQILHWRGENPHDPRIGYSPLETLRSVVAEDAALQQATVELANAGLTEPTWVFRPADAPQWSNDARKGFEEDLTNRMRRRNKMPVVLEEGMEMKSFGVSPKDAEMMAVRRWAIERVASLYGVPLGMVGLADNLEQAQSQFYSDTLPPYCEGFARMLNQRVLVRAYNWTDGCFEFNLDEKHMGDNRLTALTSASGRPVLLTNEARAKLNLPPVDGGDELVTPMNVIVGENPRPSTDVMPIQDPNGPLQDGSHREPKALPAVGRKELLRTKSQQTELERQHRSVDRFQGVLETHFARLERSMREKSRQSVKATADDWRRWDKELSRDLHAALEAVVAAEGAIYVFKLLGDDFDMRRVKNYLLATADGAAGAINDNFKAEIDDLGQEEAFARRGQHVASAGASLGASAIRFAREEAAKQSPDYEQRVKTWIPNTQRHAAFGGQTVPVGAPWPAGFAPGSPPGCQCSMSIH